MKLVVDASVAVKWFVEENLREEARLLVKQGHELVSPDFILIETANIAWKKALRGEIGKDQARTIVAAIPQYVPTLYPSSELMDRALELAFALNHPVYDCLYLSCADIADGVLITADEKLCEAVQGTDFERLVRYLGDPGFLKEDTETLPPLKIPLSKIEHLINLVSMADKTRQNVRGAFDDGKAFRIGNPEEMGMYIKSPSIRRIKNFLDGLPKDERVDLWALGCLGQGYSGTEIQVILRNARDAVDRSHDNIYLLSLTCYLQDGLALLREMGGES